MNLSSSPHISVIIPVFNEEASLPKVLTDLPKDLITDIVVVNNGSTDNSASVAKQHGARVIDEPKRGYGQACLTGILHLEAFTDIVVFLDGDYSDHPDQAKRLIDPIINEGYDLVLGSRMQGARERGAMTPQSYFGNKLACFLMKLFWGAQYTDLGPFRAIRYDMLEMISMTDRDFGWTIEMQIKAIEHKLKTKEVAVDYRKREGQSKISGTLKGTVLAGEKILRTIFKYKFLKRNKSVSQLMA